MLSEFLTAVTSIFTTAIGMVTEVGTAIISDPILITMAGLSVAGIGIGFFKRLTSVN